MSGKKNTFITTPIILALTGFACAIMTPVGFSNYQTERQTQTAPNATTLNDTNLNEFQKIQPNPTMLSNNPPEYVLYGKR